MMAGSEIVALPYHAPAASEHASAGRDRGLHLRFEFFDQGGRRERPKLSGIEHRIPDFHGVHTGDEAYRKSSRMGNQYDKTFCRDAIARC